MNNYNNFTSQELNSADSQRCQWGTKRCPWQGGAGTGLSPRGRSAGSVWNCACPRSQFHRRGRENDSKGRRGHCARWASPHAERNWILSLLAVEMFVMCSKPKKHRWRGLRGEDGLKCFKAEKFMVKASFLDKTPLCWGPSWCVCNAVGGGACLATLGLCPCWGCHCLRCWAAQPALVTRWAWGTQWGCCGWNSRLMDAFLGLTQGQPDPFFTHCELFLSPAGGGLALVTGLLKGFWGHKLGSFTHLSLSCWGEKYIYMVFLGFPTPAHPHCESGFTAGSKPKIAVCDGAKGCNNMWSGEAGNEPGGKQRGVLKYVGGK